jgi:thiol-disulfide isomerase/thioredoxin
MRILLSCGWIFFLSLTLLGQKSVKPKLKCGEWTGKLSLNTSTTLPFQFSVIKGYGKTQSSTYNFLVGNGQEQIELIANRTEGDSIHLEFPSFGTKLVVKADGKKKLSGYWLNPNKGSNYRTPCTITYGYGKRFDNPKLYISSIQPANYEGRWETTFEPGTADAYKAVGIFDQDFNGLKGTFLTETGDYRFLDGNVAGDSLYLSCFDGSHAFLFTGLLKNNKISGNFYSGKHWQTNWEATRNPLFELTNPDSLTYLVKNDPINFNLKDLSGNDFSFPNERYKNKVVIIQIMGTWCPNCMDETRYFKDLYAKYHNEGLEVISVCYETGTDPVQHINRINTLKERLELDFTFLVGGTANKGLASEHFNMLNQVISFPTAIFIGKDGTVKKVHTGFNGPGTGSYYQTFISETDLFIQELLSE